MEVTPKYKMVQGPDQTYTMTRQDAENQGYKIPGDLVKMIHVVKDGPMVEEIDHIIIRVNKQEAAEISRALFTHMISVRERRQPSLIQILRDKLERFLS